MIFIDTSFFFALFSARDRHHQDALETLAPFKRERRQPKELFLTTNHVVFETITLAQRRGGHSLAVAVGEALLGRKLAQIHQATADEEKAAFEYLRKFDDQEFSAVDCLSFVVMERLGIREALAFDRHFSHRFIVRP